jgi:hypothetical protein
MSAMTTAWSAVMIQPVIVSEAELFASPLGLSPWPLSRLQPAARR